MNRNLFFLLIVNFLIFSCDSKEDITSFKIKNPYKNKALKIDENVSVSIFPGEAGGIEQNVNRWRRQLNLQPVSLESMNKEKKQNPFLGEYYIFLEQNNTIDKAIIAAIIPQEQQTIFIKMNTSAKLSYERKYELTLFTQSLYFDENKKINFNAPSNWLEKKPINMSTLYFELNDEN